MSLVPAAVAAGLTLEPAQLELKAANGSEIRVLGTVKLLMRVGESSLPLECMVVNNVSEILLGLAWLNEFAESWDFRHEVIVLGGSQHKLHGPPRTLKSRRVEVAGTTTVPARSEVNLVARVIFGDLALYDSDWITRPAQMPGKLMVARTLVANQGSTVVVRVLNHTDKEVVLDVGTPICDSEEISTMPALEEELSEKEQDPIKLLLQAVDSSVSDPEKAELAVLLKKYRHVFSQGPLDMGRTDVVQHEIDMGDNKPVRQALRPQPLAMLPMMGDHITKLSQVCFFHLRRIRVVRHSLTRNALLTLVHAFVCSRLDFCNSAMFGVHSYLLDRLQSILNAAARLILQIHKFSSISSAIRDELHWLPVQSRIVFKQCLLVRNCLAGSAPSYLAELCIPVSSVSGRRQNLRSASRGTLVVPRVRTERYGRWGFSVSGPHLWNSLPPRICSLIEKPDLFKRELKHYLMQQQS